MCVFIKIFKTCNFILIKDNLGYSKGYNYAFKELKNSTDDYYFLLNNDTIINNITAWLILTFPILDRFMNSSMDY